VWIWTRMRIKIVNLGPLLACNYPPTTSQQWYQILNQKLPSWWTSIWILIMEIFRNGRQWLIDHDKNSHASLPWRQPLNKNLGLLLACNNRVNYKPEVVSYFRFLFLFVFIFTLFTHFLNLRRSPKKISRKMAVLETIWAVFLAVKPIFALSWSPQGNCRT